LSNKTQKIQTQTKPDPKPTKPNSKYPTPNQIKVDFQQIRGTIMQAYKKSFAKGFNNAI
jgi:hypothetical protein